MTNTTCRKCRHEGVKLFLKGERCNLPKCSITRRNYGPGIHGNARSKRPTEYAVQLREKQKAKSIYGLREKQFNKYFLSAAKSKSNTGEKLLQQLELRLDNIVYRLGFAPSRRSARQIVTHGKIFVNGRKVNIPSFSCKEKDIIKPNDKNITFAKLIETPIWLNLDKKELQGQLLKIPSRDEIQVDIKEQLIIEFYNR